jgi:hypothetical protein
LLRLSVAGGCVAFATALAVSAAVTAAPGRSPANGCRTVPAPLLRLLEAGIGLNTPAHLQPARLVARAGPGRVYFVAARIRSQALKQRRPVALWATSSLTGGAVVVSLNPAAKHLSDWRSLHDTTTPRVTSSTAGARRALACVTRLPG